MVQGENIERFLNMCSHHNINIFNITKIEEKCYLKIYAADFFLLKSIIKKSNVKIKIIRKKGFLFWLKKQAKRKTFLITPFLCLLLLWINSHFLWGVHIEGNLSVTNNLIEDFLQEQGIYYGMPLSDIPIQDLKTNLRNKYDEITWVSIYLEGTYLQISLKERDTVDYMKHTSITTGENLVAPTSGVIESILLRQGTSVVKPGDIVKKGDLLIEGKVSIPAEDGTVKETKYCKADGDVYLVYPYPIEETITLEHIEKEYTGRDYQKYILTFKDKLWEFPFFQVPFLKYDCITEPLNVPVLDYFSIPIEIHQATYRDYVFVKKKHPKEDALKILEEKLNKIIISLEEKGVQIIEKNVKISTNDVYLSMMGELTLKERCNSYELMEESQ